MNFADSMTKSGFWAGMTYSQKEVGGWAGAQLYAMTDMSKAARAKEKEAEDRAKEAAKKAAAAAGMMNGLAGIAAGVRGMAGQSGSSLVDEMRQEQGDADTKTGLVSDKDKKTSQEIWNQVAALKEQYPTMGEEAIMARVMATSDANGDIVLAMKGADNLGDRDDKSMLKQDVDQFKKENPGANIYDYMYSIYKDSTNGKYDNAAASETLKDLAERSGMSPEEFLKEHGGVTPRSTNTANVIEQRKADKWDDAARWDLGHPSAVPDEKDSNSRNQYKMYTVGCGITIAIPNTYPAGVSITGAFVKGDNGDVGLGIYFSYPEQRKQDALVADGGSSVGQYSSDKFSNIGQFMNAIPNDVLNSNSYNGIYKKPNTGDIKGEERSIPSKKDVSIGFGDVEMNTKTLINLNSGNVGDFFEKKHLQFQILAKYIEVQTQLLFKPYEFERRNSNEKKK